MCRGDCFQSVGEKSRKGEMKVIARIKNEHGIELELFTLGSSHAAQWKNISYDEGMEIEGVKAVMRESYFTKEMCMVLVAFNDHTLRIRKLESDTASAFAEDELELSNLTLVKQATAGATWDIVLYVIQVHWKGSRPRGDRTVPCQEVSVRDQEQKSTILVLMGDAVGCMKPRCLFLVKLGNTYKDEPQVWGSSMVATCPEDLEFNVEGPVQEI